MGRKDTPSSKYLDALRLRPDEVSAVLNELDATQNAAVAAELRYAQRTSISQTAGFIVRMFQPGGTIVNYLVKLRNISRTGVAFLHGSFVYQKTACTFLLRTRSGQVREIAGKVVRCRHVRNNVHEVGLEFDQPIDLAEFIEDPRLKPDPGRSTPMPALPTFVGTVLYVSDNPDDRELLAFHLKRMGVRAVAVSAGQYAEQIRASRCSLILMDVWCSVGVGQLLSQVRALGYAGPIVGLVSDPESEKEARAAGFTDVLAKPVTPATLTAMLSRHLPHSSGESDVELKPLLSEHWDDAMMRPLIITFLSRLESRVREIDKLLLSGNRTSLNRCCTELRSTAIGYGFPQIGNAAGDLAALAEADGDPLQCRQKLDTLAQHCRAACAIVRRAQSA